LKKNNQVIKIQSYKDWKDDLITTQELLEGKTFLAEYTSLADLEFDKELEKSLDELFDEVTQHNIRVKDWSKEPHHKHCCCDKCAPTREDLHRKVREFNKEAADKAEKQLWLGDDESLAPSDCEPE
jgi:hypothetical protein